MPETCNGIARLDNTKEFCKLNCKWSLKSSGRKKSVPKSVRLKRDKGESKQICLTLDKYHFELLNRQAHHKSLQFGYPISANELIRQMLDATFPKTTQYDMFEAKNG